MLSVIRLTIPVEYPEEKFFPIFSGENNHVKKSFDFQKASRFPNQSEIISNEKEGIWERGKELISAR